MARLKKAIKGFLWALCAVPVMAVFLAVEVMTYYMDGR